MEINAPERTLLISGMYTAGCAQNYMIGDTVKESVEDVDGVSMIALKARHDEGPYDGALSECFDGEFEARSPPRVRVRRHPERLNTSPHQRVTSTLPDSLL